MNAHDILILLNLVLLESMLSVDNAAVLAVMVKDLPDGKKQKALRYGLLGAYLFRGASLFFVSYLMNMWVLKVIGGLYLVWLAIGHFTKKNDTIEEVSDKQESKIYRWAKSIGLSKFWSTVILVEIMDMAFSVDNVFAAVAMTDKIWLILTGVFIGILAMRYVAGIFTKLMEKYPDLESSAFYVIFLLGLKLIFSEVFPKDSAISTFINSHQFDLYFSISMIAVFLVPIFNRKKIKSEDDYGKGFEDPDYEEKYKKVIIDLDSEEPVAEPIYIFRASDLYDAHNTVKQTYEVIINRYGIQSVEFVLFWEYGRLSDYPKGAILLRFNHELLRALKPIIQIDGHDFPQEIRPKVEKVQFTKLNLFNSVYVIDVNSLRTIIKNALKEIDVLFKRKQYFDTLFKTNIFVHEEQEWANVKDRILSEAEKENNG